MKFLFDLFPVILFFVVFKWGQGHPADAQSAIAHYLSGFVNGGQVLEAQAPILLATAVAIVATFAQIGFLLIRRKKIDNMLWLSLIIITVFGGATIYFHNETFIKWKPTVLYWCFAAGLLIARLGFRRNLIRSMMEKQVTLPDPVWNKLYLAWLLFFLSMGLVNLFVAYSFDTATWVNFKLFGFMGLMFAFIIVQSLMLSKYIKEGTE